MVRARNKAFLYVSTENSAERLFSIAFLTFENILFHFTYAHGLEDSVTILNLVSNPRPTAVLTKQ